MNSISILKRFAGWLGPVGCVLVTCAIFIGATCVIGVADEPTTQPKPWDQCTPAELAAVARQLRLAGPQGQDSRALLVEHVGKLYLSASASGQLEWQDWMPLVAEVAEDVPAPLWERIVADIEKGLLADKVAVRSVSLGTWRAIVGVAIKTFPPDRNARWAQSLHEAFLSDAKGWASLGTGIDVDSLAAVLKLLGDQRADTAAATFAATVWKTDIWQSWAPPYLEWLVSKLPSDEAQRRKITDLMLERLLSARKAAGPISAEDWQRLAVLVRPGLPAEQCSQLLEGMRGAFYGEAGGFQSLSPRGYGRLIRAMKALGASNEDVADLPVKFVLEKAVWRTWDRNGLVGLAAAIGSGKDDKAQSARVLVFNLIQTKYLTGESAVRSISCAQWKAIAQHLGGDAPKDAKADWVEKLHKAFAGDPKILSGLTKDQVSDLAEAMRILGSPKAGVVVLAWMSSRPRSR
jgi:hypothetical protein